MGLYINKAFEAFIARFEMGLEPDIEGHDFHT